jgi:hypothetical protein
MRELAAASLLLLALVVGALAPIVWNELPRSAALASSAPSATPSWRGKDGGIGFVVCGSSDTWTRPTLAEENAHLAAVPKYSSVRADDSYSAAWTPFHTSASLYDGSDLSARDDLIAMTGLWSDPDVASTTARCTSSEPQVWLIGHVPTKYFADNPQMASLRVAPGPGYRLVVLTGIIRRELVVASATKLGVFQMPANAITPTPTPAPKPTPVYPGTRSQTASVPPASTFPITDRPLELVLPAACRILTQMRHDDGFGAVWTVQCGSAMANLFVALAAMRQGWSHMQGPPIGVGMQTYEKGTLSMQLAYRLDGPAYSDPFVLVQYSRPFASGGPSPASPMAYLRVPTGFDLPAGCAWGKAPAGFTDDGAYKLPFACTGIRPDQIQSAFTRALQSQGWRIDNGGFGFLSYAKDDLRLTAAFANGKAEPSETPWVVEALCCFQP